MKVEKLKEIGIGLLVVGLQVIFFRHLSIYSIQPDMVLVFLLWFMIRRNRTAAILMAALLGFTQDVILDQWGLNMFSKTITVFILYRWIPEEYNGRLQLSRVIAFVFIAALVHNTFFAALSSAVQIYSNGFLYWKIWLGNSFYTTLAAGIIQLFRVE